MVSRGHGDLGDQRRKEAAHEDYCGHTEPGSSILLQVAEAAAPLSFSGHVCYGKGQECLADSQLDTYGVALDGDADARYPEEELQDGGGNDQLQVGGILSDGGEQAVDGAGDLTFIGCDGRDGQLCLDGGIQKRPQVIEDNDDPVTVDAYDSNQYVLHEDADPDVLDH